MKEAKPKLGWFVFALALAVRVWASPLIVVGWLVGTICGALSFGFAAAWELPEFAWAARLRQGPAPKKQAHYVDNDDFDEDDESRV
jgi:hypothetical protein